MTTVCCVEGSIMLTGFGRESCNLKIKDLWTFLAWKMESECIALAWEWDVSFCWLDSVWRARTAFRELKHETSTCLEVEWLPKQIRGIYLSRTCCWCVFPPRRFIDSDVHAEGRGYTFWEVRDCTGRAGVTVLDNAWVSMGDRRPVIRHGRCEEG